MSKTEVSGKQVKDGSIELVDLSTALSNTISGKAEAADVTALDTRVTAVESDVAALQSASAPNLSDLGEVSITSPSSGQVLKYNGTGWANAADSTFSGDYADLSNKPTIPSALDDLSDVTISSPSNDQVLKYNGTAWVNSAAPAAGATDLDGLSDVAVSSAAKGQFIVHNGTSFVNSNTIEASGAAVKPLIVKGAASQTANLIEVQNSSATALLAVDSSGKLGIGTSSPTYNLDVSGSVDAYVTGRLVNSNAGTSAGSQLIFGNNANAVGVCLFSNSSTSTAIGGAGSFNIYQAQNAPIITYTSGTERMRLDGSGQLGIGAASPGAQLHVVSGAAARKGLIVKGAASQSENLFEVQNSSGTALFSMDKDGNMTTPPWVKGSGPYIAFEETAAGYRGFGFSTYQNTVFISRTAVNSRTFQNKNGQWGFSHNLETYVTGINNISPSAQLHVSVADANYKGLIVQGAASQVGNLFEAQNSASTAVCSIDKDGAIAANRVALTGTYAMSNVSSTPGLYTGNDGGYAWIRLTGSNTGMIEFAAANTANWRGRIFANTVGEVVIGTSNSANTSRNYPVAFGGYSSAAITTSIQAAGAKGIVVVGAASQTANLFEAQNSAGTALASISSAGTVHAARYTETVANAFNTSLAPSSGTLTVDSSAGNVVLGALSASVTTWAFTNVPTDNSRVTTVSAVIAGNTSYTYGSSCSVNGSAVATGVQWFGGTAPTPSSTTDVLTFAIVRDSAGTIRVLGSAQTIDSVVGSASAGIDGAGSANYLSKWTDANTIANSAVYESAGNVGIGTTSPGENLHIRSSAPRIRLEDTDGGYSSISGNGGVGAVVLQADPTNAVANSFIGFDVDGVSRASIDSAGKLTLSQVGNGLAVLDAAGQGFNAQHVILPGRTYIGSALTSYPTIGYNCIPTTTAGGLTFQKAAADLSWMINLGNNNQMSFQYATSASAGTNFVPVTAMAIDSTGSVLIRGTANSTNFTTQGTAAIKVSYSHSAEYGMTFRGVSGDGTPIAFANSSNAWVGSIGTSATTTSYYTSSDYRLKENVLPINSALNKISLLKPSVWTWKNGQTQGQGFLAHELAEVLPDAVNGQKDAVDSEGNPVYQSVDYSKLTPLLAAALKELSAKVDALQAEKDALEARIAALENN